VFGRNAPVLQLIYLLFYDVEQFPKQLENLENVRHVAIEHRDENNHFDWKVFLNFFSFVKLSKKLSNSYSGPRKNGENLLNFRSV